MGLGRRSRRSVIAVTWLCFLVAAMPCMTAWAACCPSNPSEIVDSDSNPHAGHSHHENPAPSGHEMHGGDSGLQSASPDDSHDCGAIASTCCDEAVPTLEDRSPKPLPTAGDAGLSASLETAPGIDARTQEQHEQATGPPERLRLHPRPHLEHCSFLI